MTPRRRLPPPRKHHPLAANPRGLSRVQASCVLGVSMSYFAFLARSAVSATYFTVIGNVCKVLAFLSPTCPSQPQTC